MKSLFIEPLIPLCEAEAAATPAELEQMREYSSCRRRESLAWRAVVRRELGPRTEIAYNDLGAPILPGSGLFLGISHGADRVAVCISDTPCGVDIESVERNFDRIISRYMSPLECTLCDEKVWPAVVWCAKETLYKLSGRRELDLLRDLRIEQVDLESGVLTGRIQEDAPMQLSFRCEDGFVAVYVF